MYVLCSCVYMCSVCMCVVCMFVWISMYACVCAWVSMCLRGCVAVSIAKCLCMCLITISCKSFYGMKLFSVLCSVCYLHSLVVNLWLNKVYSTTV